MLTDYMSILILNEDESSIKSLTKSRSLSALPIGGRYRIIDFCLSNAVNSGINNVGVFIQSKARSLVDHLGTGKPWDLDRKLNGLFIFNFGEQNSFLSDIEMLKNNLEYLYRSKQDKVIVSSSSMICNIDLKAAAKFHEESGKDITMVYKKINDGKNNFLDANVLNLDENNNVIGIGKNTGVDNDQNISMEMFILKKDLLIDIINKCIKVGYWSSLKQWIYRNIETLDVNAYGFKGYVKWINSVNDYYKANMDMLNLEINKELFFSNGLVYTKVMDEAPTRYFNGSTVKNSLIANGCLVGGTVENSVLSRRVIVHKGAEIKNCIILQNCEIKENAKLTNVIIDKNVIIEENKELKGDDEFPLVIEKKSLFNL
ncbi:MAG: glucose-1-phosphate adenylyltransferase subunit GlgD [Bacillota bacterium]|nr:glucose-1-phosphate adenylyltransferase subunit GlgD [Bacillota bacterium]